MCKAANQNLKKIIPINKIGDSASWAFFTAVTVFVTPGPAVTAATPTDLERRATASAANTAETCINHPMYFRANKFYSITTS
jgi:hypothetical protein